MIFSQCFLFSPSKEYCTFHVGFIPYGKTFTVLQCPRARRYHLLVSSPIHNLPAAAPLTQVAQTSRLMLLGNRYGWTQEKKTPKSKTDMVRGNDWEHCEGIRAIRGKLRFQKLYQGQPCFEENERDIRMMRLEKLNLQKPQRWFWRAPHLTTLVPVTFG